MLDEATLSTLEKLCDNNYNDEIEVSARGVKVKCEKIAFIPIEKQLYFILKPTELLDVFEENEALCLVYDMTSFTLLEVTDPNVHAALYQEYLKLIN